MTLRENAAVLETYLHNIRNIEEMPPGPVELDALDAAVETMKHTWSAGVRANAYIRMMKDCGRKEVAKNVTDAIRR